MSEPAMQNDINFPDYYLAVFNGHVNMAGERALKIVRCMLRSDAAIVMLAGLEADYKNGIMAIFNRRLNEATTAFCTLVYTFANGLDKHEG